MPPTHQSAAHWEKSRVIILCYPLSHDLKQCRGASGDGVQFAGGVALYQNAGNAVNVGAVCDGLKSAFLNADSVNFCETLFLSSPLRRW